MFALAQELSYYASFVDGGASSGLINLGQRLWAVSNIATAAQSSIMGLISPLQQVANSWSQREEQINNIARTLRQYEYVGQSVVQMHRDIATSMPGATQAAQGAEFTRRYASQFAEARANARGILTDMNVLAARLPGGTDDYMQAFQQSLPFLSQGHGMTEGRAVRISSYMSAGAIAGGIGADQGARDLMQFFSVGPHMTDRSWTEVWKQLATLNGHAVTAAQISAMSMDDKIKVAENISLALQPQMDAAGDSYAAVMGTFDSFRHEIYLVATEPIFDGFKKAIEAANTQLAIFTPILNQVGFVLGTKVAIALQWVTEKIMGIGPPIDRMSAWLTTHAVSIGNTAQTVVNFFGKVFGTVRQAGSGIADAAGGALGTTSMMAGIVSAGLPAIMLRVLGIGMGPIGFIISDVIVRMFTTGNTGGSVASFTSALVDVITPILVLARGAYALYDAFMMALVPIVAVVLPAVLNILASIVTSILSVLGVVLTVFQILGFIVMSVALVLLAGFMGAAAVLEIFMVALGATINGFIAVFGGAVVEGVSFVDLVRVFGRTLTTLSSELGESVNYLLFIMHLRTEGEYLARQTELQSTTAADSTGAWLAELRATLTAATADMTRTGHGTTAARPHTHNDFRFSRFDITQKFADGFDPDRVSTAFVTDLQAMAERPLSSGFTPGFSST